MSEKLKDLPCVENVMDWQTYHARGFDEPTMCKDFDEWRPIYDMEIDNWQLVYR